MNSQHMKIVKIPDFDGKVDVTSFFTFFELTCNKLGATNDATKKAWLLGRLKGEAQAWQQSKGT